MVLRSLFDIVEDGFVLPDITMQGKRGGLARTYAGRLINSVLSGALRLFRLFLRGCRLAVCSPPRSRLSSAFPSKKVICDFAIAKKDALILKSKMSSDLCMSCRNFDIHSFSRDPLFYRGYEYATVATSAHEGCRFCSNLRADFENAEWEWKITGRNQKRRPLPRDWKDKFWVHLRLDQHFDGIQGQPADTLGALRAHTLVAILARRDMFTSGTSEVGSAAKVVRFHLIAETGKLLFVWCLLL